MRYFLLPGRKSILRGYPSGGHGFRQTDCGYGELRIPRDPQREEGVLVSPRDAAAFAEAVLEILRNPARGDELGFNGRQKALRYSWDNVSDAIYGFYEEILNG